MKQISTMMMIFFTTILLVACGSDDTAPKSGVWNEDIYINESLGIQFQLPRNWQSVQGNELSEVLGAGIELMLEMENNYTPEEILEFMETHPLCDMYATNPYTGSTVQVMFQRLPRSARRYSSEKALELILEDLGEEMPNFNYNISSETTQIGRYEFYSADTHFEIVPGVEINMRMYFHLEDRNANVIMMGSMMDDVFDEILPFFNEPGADRIEIAEAELVEETDLIGTWAWNIDDEYLLIFNENGTGKRGYVIDSNEDDMDELVEEFKWEISNDILYIDFSSVSSFGTVNEEWNTIIDGNVLTIESRQALDVRYSYIKN